MTSVHQLLPLQPISDIRRIPKLYNLGSNIYELKLTPVSSWLHNTITIGLNRKRMQIERVRRRERISECQLPYDLKFRIYSKRFKYNC